MSRFAFNPSDIGSTGASMAPAGGAGIDIHRASVFQPPIEHAASHAAGLAAGAEHSVMAALGAAAEPISPLIQMIMRMPGQIGLVSSMFEAFGNFLMGHAHLLGAFDPSLLSVHAHIAHTAFSSLGAEHIGIDPSLLPSDAPILQSMHGLGQSGADLVSGRAGSFANSDLLKDSVSLRDQLKVSGPMDLNRAQFETGRGLSSQVDGLSQKGEALSGPALRETSTANHLAGAQRLFSDRAVSISHSPLTSATPAVASAQSVPITPSSTTLPSSLNVNGSAFGQESVGQMADAGSLSSQNVGAEVNQIGKQAAESGSAVGPSGAVSEHLGGNKLVAMDKGVTTFHPTFGQGNTATGYDANYLQQQSTSASQTLGGLKAQQLSLDSIKQTVKAPVVVHAKPAIEHLHASGKPTIDHQGHQTAGNSHNHAASGAKTMDGISHRPRMNVAYQQPRVTSANVQPAQTADGGVASGDAAQVAANNQAAIDGSQIATTDGSQVAAPTDATHATTSAPTTYTIRAGDCLWNIAKDHLGEATRWSEIYKMNADVLGTNPSLIHPGTDITLPGGGTDVASGLESGTYIVKSGDNLWNISKHFLGDGSKWGELYKINQDVVGSNPSLIMPGQELHIPGADGASATVAQAPAAQGAQQLAQAAPQGTMASAAPGDLSGAAPVDASATTAAVPQTPVQSYGAPTEVPSAGAVSAAEIPQPVDAVAPAATAAPTAPATPHAVHGGPGAAAAATLAPEQPTLAELHQLGATTPTPKNEIVSSSLLQFIRKAR